MHKTKKNIKDTRGKDEVIYECRSKGVDGKK